MFLIHSHVLGCISRVIFGGRFSRTTHLILRSSLMVYENMKHTSNPFDFCSCSLFIGPYSPEYIIASVVFVFYIAVAVIGGRRMLVIDYLQADLCKVNKRQDS